MRATNKTFCENKVAVDMPEFQKMMGCGYPTAKKISEAAGARIKIGKRVLINLDKVQLYLDSISG